MDGVLYIDSEHDTQSTSNSLMEEQPDLTEVFQEARQQTKLPVCCGNEKGDLYRQKYYIGEECISCKGKWYSPHQFETFGGKGHHKKWKTSIYYKPSNGFQQVQLLKLIQSGVLPEFGHLRQSLYTPVVQTDGRNNNEIPERGLDTRQLGSSSDESVARRIKMNRRKTVCKMITEPEGSTDSDRGSSSDESVARRLKNNRRRTVMLAEKITEPEGSTDSDRGNSSDESVAKRIKMNRRKTVCKMITEPVGSTDSDRDSAVHPVDASEPGVSPVVEEAVQTTDDPTGAGQLSLSASPAEWQNPVASEETLETRHLQLYELLTKQFNTINNTLQSIDLSLKKLVEK